jgi:hypothetical protein
LPRCCRDRTLPAAGNVHRHALAFAWSSSAGSFSQTTAFRPKQARRARRSRRSLSVRNGRLDRAEPPFREVALSAQLLAHTRLLGFRESRVSL